MHLKVSFLWYLRHGPGHGVDHSRLEHPVVCQEVDLPPLTPTQVASEIAIRDSLCRTGERAEIRCSSL